MTDRPNIVLIMTDQQRGDCLSAERHPVLLTPNMDSIGHRGTRFRKAYSTCPVCIPARRSLLSGQFPPTHGLVGYREGRVVTPVADGSCNLTAHVSIDSVAEAAPRAQSSRIARWSSSPGRADFVSLVQTFT